MYSAGMDLFKMSVASTSRGIAEMIARRMRTSSNGAFVLFITKVLPVVSSTFVT